MGRKKKIPVLDFQVADRETDKAVVEYLKKATMIAMLLNILDDKGGCYAAEIGREIKLRSEGEIVRASPPYKTIERLLRRGYVTQRDLADGSGTVRRYYFLTEQGKNSLAIRRSTIDNYMRAFNKVVPSKDE